MVSTHSKSARLASSRSSQGANGWSLISSFAASAPGDQVADGIRPSRAGSGTR